MGMWKEEEPDRLDVIAAKLLERADKYQEAAKRETNERAFIAMQAVALALVEFHAAITGGELDDP